MLGKHVWELIHKPDKLWVQMLSAKYLIDSHILSTSVPRGCSYTWRSIVQAAKILKPGLIVRVGQGDVSLWYEKWLHKGRICDRVAFVDMHDINLKIHDICHDGVWCFDTIYTHLSLEIKLEI